MDGTSRNRIRADIVTYCRNGEAMIRRRPLSPRRRYSRRDSRSRGSYENSKNQSNPATLLEIRPGNPVNGIESSSSFSEFHEGGEEIWVTSEHERARNSG